MNASIEVKTQLSILRQEYNLPSELSLSGCLMLILSNLSDMQHIIQNNDDELSKRITALKKFVIKVETILDNNNL